MNNNVYLSMFSFFNCFFLISFPASKLAQAAKFNDPNNACKVMVASDAIGMGLNL